MNESANIGMVQQLRSMALRLIHFLETGDTSPRPPASFWKSRSAGSRMEKMGIAGN